MVAQGSTEVLAIIPARGGSKGIPRKNLRILGRYPLIAYSIAAARQSNLVTRTIVSTDDEEIASVASQYGAEVPFMRPAELAYDDTPDYPAFKHALDWLSDHEDYRPEIIVQLRPTSPFRSSGIVDDSVGLLLSDPKADCVRGVVVSSQNPYKMWRMNCKGYMRPLLPDEFSESYNMPRQGLPTTYWQTGHIDVIRYETIITKGSLTGDLIRPFPIDRAYCVDIDSPKDWEQAEWILENSEVDIVLPESAANYFSLEEPSDVLHTLGQTELLVLDFDGVLTDNRVWVLEDGREAVVANRGDGKGIAMLRERGVEVLVLSGERNPVVTARCRKLNLPNIQGVEDKGEAIKNLALERDIELSRVAYVGNDVNDLSCMRLVGCAVAVADAHAKVLAEAHFILHRPGGSGAVRELCDIIIEQLDKEA